MIRCRRKKIGCDQARFIAGW